MPIRSSQTEIYVDKREDYLNCFSGKRPAQRKGIRWSEAAIGFLEPSLTHQQSIVRCQDTIFSSAENEV